MPNIFEWDIIKNDYNNALIVGNGGSIAVNQAFGYASLYEKARELNLIDEGLQQIFVNFSTTDFEKVLHKLLQAKIVTKALSIDNDQINKAYENCRSSLINVIQRVHPKYDEIDPDQFFRISNFLKNFKTVISLNYDLVIYWSMYHGNQPVFDNNELRSGQRFKDCFTETSPGGNCFNLDWDYLRKPHAQRTGATLIFYLHGNLSLADFINENLGELEVKITSPGDNQLETIYRKWGENSYSPLFICEGEGKRKLTSIKESVYLTTIYHQVFKSLGENIVIYGWNMNDEDDHIVEQLSRVNKINPLKKLAISVYLNGEEDDFIGRVQDKIYEKINKDLHIDFYNSASSNCWNNN